MIIQLLKNFLFIPEPPTRGFARRQSGKYRYIISWYIYSLTS